MDFFIIKNIVELKENKKIIIKNQNNVDFLNTYSFFEYLFDNYKEKKFLIFIIIKKNFFFCLPLSNFYYFKQEFYTFIGGPYISQERSILHNIKNINLFNLCLNKILENSKKNQIKLLLNNISDEQSKFFLSSTIFFLKKYTINKCILNEHTIFATKLLEAKRKKQIDFKLRKFTRFTNIKSEDIKIDIIEKTFFNINDITEFINNNKRINSKEKKILIYDLQMLFNFKINNYIEISILYYKKIIFSIIVGINSNKSFLFLSPVFNQNYKKFSFGFYHLVYLMKKKKIEGYNNFVLGPGNQEYKNDFNIVDSNFYSFTNSKFLKVIYFFKNLLKK
jgi:hypothetical protein